MNCTYTDFSGNLIPTACNDVVGSLNLLTGVLGYASYGYLVIPASAYLFTALFGCLTLLHFGLACYYEIWWLLPTLVIGSALEAAGWGGRIWSVTTTYWDHNEGGQWNEYGQGSILQIVCLIIAPTFFSAANYTLLGRVVRSAQGHGRFYTSITANSVSTAFVTADFICLLCQAAGGSITGTSGISPLIGIDVMAGGVIAQMFVTVIYLFLFLEFCWRFYKDQPVLRQYDIVSWAKFCCCCCNIRKGTPPQVISRDELPTKSITIMLSLMIWTTLLIIIRSIYRCAELLTYNGYNGGAYSNQPMFIGMDASLMFILLVSYGLCHPAVLNRQTKRMTHYGSAQSQIAMNDK